MDNEFEKVFSTYQMVAGVDEVGRGPIFGNTVASAVILDPANPIEGLKDSKKLSAKKREALFSEIKEKALAYCIAEASVEEIDQLNILQAALLAMKRAVDGLQPKADFALIDGNKIPSGLLCPSQTVVKGDSRVEAIMAASILAKQHRDAQMIELDKKYPGYGIAKHMGYPTAQHLKAIKEIGITPLHRRSFKPVKAIIS